MVKLLLSILMTLVLVACQSTPQQSSSVSVLEQFALAEIRVDFSTLKHPLKESVLEADIKNSLSTGQALKDLGTNLGLTNKGEVQSRLEAAISANIQSHVRDAIAPSFKGARPARAVVFVESVFIRSAASLQQLTGAKVTVNGERRPDNPEVIASIIIYDQETGLGLSESGTVKKVDDGTIVLAGGGPRSPQYSKSQRLDQLVFEMAQDAAKRIREDAADEGGSWSGSGY